LARYTVKKRAVPAGIIKALEKVSPYIVKIIYDSSTIFCIAHPLLISYYTPCCRESSDEGRCVLLERSQALQLLATAGIYSEEG